MPVSIVGFFTLTEAKYKRELLEALEKPVKHARDNEPGTTNYSFLEDSEDELTLFAVEEFATEEAFAHHCESEPFKEFFGVAGPMIEAGSMKVHQKTSKSGLVAGFAPPLIHRERNARRNECFCFL